MRASGVTSVNTDWKDKFTTPKAENATNEEKQWKEDYEHHPGDASGPMSHHPVDAKGWRN